MIAFFRIRPAAAFAQVYSVEGIYAMPRSFGVSVLDTKTSGMGAGLGYFRTADRNQVMTQGARLALS